MNQGNVQIIPVNKKKNNIQIISVRREEDNIVFPKPPMPTVGPAKVYNFDVFFCIRNIIGTAACWFCFCS